MQYKLPEIIDIPQIQSLLDALHNATGVTSAIVDINGVILIAAGWQDICLNFHRKHPQTESLCRESDNYIRNYLDSAEPYIYYKCANGLIDASAPIIIDGMHVATIFLGQVLFEPPDQELFRKKAQQYGYCEEDYLGALAKVPVITPEKFQSMMNLFRQLAENFAHMGMTKLRLLESKRKILEQARQKLKIILDNTPPNIAIRIYSLEGKLLYWNKPAEKLFSCSQEIQAGTNAEQFIYDLPNIMSFMEIQKEPNAVIKTYGPKEWNIVTNEGSIKTIYSTVFPILIEEKSEFLCMDIDLTEQKRIEKEMARMGKLNLVGKIAASLGHEVRNPLTTVRGFLQLLASRNDFARHQETFNLMINELDRCNSIISEFLSLAQNKAIKLELKNLNSIILALAPLLEANALITNKNLKLELGNIPDLKIDEQEIRQLIFNLVRNGIEAMTSSGDIAIKTFLDKENVILAVRGISPESLEKLGTPFWTTKEDGTGLGLAVCYSIAARHKAEISVESSEQGTTFFIRFKVRKKEVQP